MKRTAPLWAVVVLALFSPFAASQTTFQDVTDTSGLNSSHVPITGHPMAGMVGGGTLADFNRDGWPDVFVLCGGTSPDKLFINDQNGGFTEEAAAWGLATPHMGSGVAVADYNNDGWPDMLVTSFGTPGAQGTPGMHKLYRNNGNGTFTDVAAQAGVNFASTSFDGFGAAFGDYNLDGWADLFISSYGPSTKGNRLFHNNADGTFTDVTIAAGITATDVHGFAPNFADMDGDRYPELILIGDTGTSEYYINNRDGTFTDSTHTVQRLSFPNGMGIAIGDVNGDMLLDFYVSDSYYSFIQTSGNKLYINQGDHVFTEEAWDYGVEDDGWGWGVIALDFDNDGLVDLGGTNGFPGPWANYPSKLFHNLGNGTFNEIAVTSGLSNYEQGRNMVHMDYDKDGDLDIAIFSSGGVSGTGPFKLYRNDLMNNNNWLRIYLDTLNHPYLAPHGLGTRIYITAGGTTQVKYMDSCQSYLGQSEMVIHAGLGSATMVDEVRIEWADGFTKVLNNVAVNQELTVTAELPLSQSLFYNGQHASMQVQGAGPGETVLFLYNWDGFGVGPANPALGGLVINLLEPVVQLGTAVADSQGVATYYHNISPNAPLQVVYTQAVIQRGTNGETSAKTNALAAPILP